MRILSLLLISALALLPVIAAAQISDRNQLIQGAAELRLLWQKRVAAGEVSATPTEPAITGGKVLTTSVDVTKPPGLPEIQLSIDTGTAGIFTGEATLVSPNGQQTFFSELTFPAYPPPPAHLTLTTLLQSSFGGDRLGLYARAGTWTIQSIQLSSRDGQFINYDNAQVSALFHAPASFTVINPNPVDKVAPVIGNGTIVTETVSLSAPHPFAVVHLPVADNLSGVVTAYVQFSKPNSMPVYADATIGAPLRQGVLTLYGELQPATPTGTYTIIAVMVCDAAGNCRTINTSSGIAAHFKETTITITN